MDDNSLGREGYRSLPETAATLLLDELATEPVDLDSIDVEQFTLIIESTPPVTDEGISYITPTDCGSCSCGCDCYC
jgi:hypothetical protein